MVITPVSIRATRPCKFCCFSDSWVCGKQHERGNAPCDHHFTISEIDELIDTYNDGGGLDDA